MEKVEHAGLDLENDHSGCSYQDRTAGVTLQRKIHQRFGEKKEKIRAACRLKDTACLRALASTEGGLLMDEYRREAWPLLLGHKTQATDVQSSRANIDWTKLPRHADEDQVDLDVDRSFIHYPNGQSLHQIQVKKQELSDVITETLRRQPYLRYFQGFHDICQVFLLVLPPEVRSMSVARLSVLRIRDFMLPTLAPALAQLRLIPAIIYMENPKLCHHISQTQPFFALSGTLTMYAHDIQEYGDIARLFDVLLARETVFSVYMFAQIVLHRSDELFKTPADEPDMLHSILSKLPKALDLDNLISKTVQLMDTHPPEQIRGWASISRFSVLKTGRKPGQVDNQTLDDGKKQFSRQVKELEWIQRRQLIVQAMMRYGKPAGRIGLAVVIGLFAFWLRKQPWLSTCLDTLWHAILGHIGL